MQNDAGIQGNCRRIDHHGSLAQCKQVQLVIDTDLNGRDDAFNPAGLLLAAVAACILKNTERIAPMIQFEYTGVTVRVHGVRQDSPPKMTSIEASVLGVKGNQMRSFADPSQGKP